MFVELIEHLRCPADHEPAALVAAASRSEHRHIVDGTLGCPRCGAEYAVRDGIARFGAAPRVASAEPSADTAFRIAAFLELTDARGFAVLSGFWCAHAEAMAGQVDTPLVLVNPPDGASIAGAAAVLETTGVVPLVDGSARALALDAHAVSGDAIQVVRAGGRVLGPAVTPLPAGLRELARDDREWIAERIPENPASRLVELKRAR